MRRSGTGPKRFGPDDMPSGDSSDFSAAMGGCASIEDLLPSEARNVPQAAHWFDEIVIIRPPVGATVDFIDALAIPHMQPTKPPAVHLPTAPIVGDPAIDFDDVAYEPDGWERYVSGG